MSSIESDPNLTRAKFALEHQFHNTDDLIRFWKWYGPARVGPDPERIDPWFQRLPSTFNVL